MQCLLKDGNGLILLMGDNSEGRSILHNVVSSSIAGSIERRMAVLLRLESLIAAFEDRRLREVLLDEGLVIIPHLANIAAHQRLNIRRGFNCSKVLEQLKEALLGTSDLRLAAGHPTGW